MPQELRIVKCYRCLTYQGDIVKKDKHWVCKMCGAKQTLKQEFGRGSGIECRKLVQKLNMKKHEFEQMAHDVILKIINEEIEMPDFLLTQTRPEDGIPNTHQDNPPKSSKWETFVEISDEDSDSETLFKQKIYKRKLYSPGSSHLEEEQLENVVSPQTKITTSTFFNFNKKSKFEFSEGNRLSQETESKPKSDSNPKPKLNPNSKWGNFVNNSDEENE